MVIEAFIEDKIEVEAEMIKKNSGRLYPVWLWDFIYNIVKLLHISLISLKHRRIFFLYSVFHWQLDPSHPLMEVPCSNHHVMLSFLRPEVFYRINDPESWVCLLLRYNAKKASISSKHVISLSKLLNMMMVLLIKLHWFTQVLHSYTIV